MFNRLLLGFEPRDHLIGVHPRLNDLLRYAASHWFGLFGDIHHAATAFADTLQEFVTPNRLADGFVHH